MKRMYLIIISISILVSAVTAQSLPKLSGEEIMRRVDANNVFDSASYSAIMEIDLGRRVLTKELTVLVEGSEKAFIEFVNPEDQGTRYLKIGKDLWMYFPTEQETVKISGHLLKEGMMGSDVSYEDALESEELTQKYTITVSGTERVNDRLCYILELKAKSRDVPYDAQKLWVDGERFVNLKAQMYAKSGKMLKESHSLKVEQFDERWYVTELLMEDALKKGEGTRFEIMDLRFDVDLPADQFSLRRLSR